MDDAPNGATGSAERKGKDIGSVIRVAKVNVRETAVRE
jgi:hypothetical protein